MADIDSAAVRQRYGRIPSRELALGYLKALKVITAADGEIAPEELEAIRKGMKRLGAPDDLVAEIEAFDPTGVSIESVLPNLRPNGKRARMLLRDAVALARADGHYAREEKAAVARTAGLLGVDETTLKTIEALVELEHAANHLRKALFPTKK